MSHMRSCGSYSCICFAAVQLPVFLPVWQGYFPLKPALVILSSWLNIIVSLAEDFPKVPCECLCLLWLSSDFWICVGEATWFTRVSSSISSPCHSPLRTDSLLPLNSLQWSPGTATPSCFWPLAGSWKLLVVRLTVGKLWHILLRN